MKREIQVFLTAVQFYTRIPCPAWLTYSDEYLNKATRYFPLIGWLVGGIAAGIFWLCSQVFPLSISLLLSMLSSIWVTGAFHEDGLADVCDGFGGGWTAPRILEIMKDSRVGTYGVVGLVSVLALKYFSLEAMPKYIIPFALLAGHSSSRFMAITILYSYSYVRANEDSKAKPVAKQLSRKDLLIAGVWGFVPLFLFRELAIFLALLPLFGIRWYLGRFFNKWISGYTGDCLGATQQITEVVFYLFVVFISHWLHAFGGLPLLTPFK
jgi:adenosylcobinamide-GDP ribazoletransferase